MTARVWTVEELDRVHPLPDGWRWHWDIIGLRWVAQATDASFDAVVADGSTVHLRDGIDHRVYPPPAAVALPVLLASKGLDSLGALADALSECLPSASASERLWATAMLRRGRVNP